MLCQKCGVRRARTIVTSCDGRCCYELHLCIECRDGHSTFPTPDEQKQVVAPAMDSAKATGLDEKSICDALGIDPEEIRRILNGQGVSDPTVWEIIKSHLKAD